MQNVLPSKDTKIFVKKREKVSELCLCSVACEHAEASPQDGCKLQDKVLCEGQGGGEKMLC
eukprot:748128-Hanusia_phi.AAC.3